jgi:ribosome-associated translation inhibitor RaiA
MKEARIGRRGSFAGAIPRPVRKAAGRTPVEATPLNVRTSGLNVDDAMKAHVRRRIGLKLGKSADHIERVTVRFEDVNGPRGGVDTACRIKIVFSGLDSVVYETRDLDARKALDRAAAGVDEVVRRLLERTRARPRPPGARAAPRRAVEPVSASRKKAASPARGASGHPAESGSLIGRRVGQGTANLELALERPEKHRRDVPVDTSLPGVSATDRKAGGGATARRNSRRNPAGASYALEDSARDTPSRKSTRKSANRSKPDSNLARRERRALQAPKARAIRAAVQKP